MVSNLGFSVPASYLLIVGSPVEELEKAGKMDIVPEECIESGFVLGESHSVEFIKDGKSFILEDDEFDDLQKSTKDMIALKLWQKSQEQK